MIRLARIVSGLVDRDLEMPKTKQRGSKKRAAASERAARLSPEERRDQLLGCAIKVFASRGFAAANHAAIARAARVSVAAVFFYFTTRAKLVDAVLKAVETFYQDTFAKAVEGDKPADLALLDLTEALTNTLGTHKDYARILREWSVSVHERTWPRYLKYYDRMTRHMADVIARGQDEGSIRADLDARDEAVMLYAVSNTLIQMMEAGERPERLDRLRRAVVQSVLLRSAP